MNGFEALKPMADQLKAAHRERTEQKKREDEIKRTIARGTREFLDTMQRTGVRAAEGVRVARTATDKDIDFASAMRQAGIEPLGAQKRVAAKKKPAQPVPRQTMADEKAVLAESLSDENDSVEFLESEDGLSFRRPEVGPDVPRDLRRGRWVVMGQLDLHGMFVEEAREAVVDFIKKSRANDRLCVRIIHGKGNGSPDRQSILREKVRRWLKQFDEVVAFAEPFERDGGAGATVVRLKPSVHPSKRGC